MILEKIEIEFSKSGKTGRVTASNHFGLENKASFTVTLREPEIMDLYAALDPALHRIETLSEGNHAEQISEKASG